MTDNEKSQPVHKIRAGTLELAIWKNDEEKLVRRKVALKIIKSGMDTEQLVTRFEAERQALALMDHPSIARVLDAGTKNPSPKSETRNPKGQPLKIRNPKRELKTAPQFGFGASDLVLWLPTQKTVRLNEVFLEGRVTDGQYDLGHCQRGQDYQRRVKFGASGSPRCRVTPKPANVPP